jgi:hypothetical protein
LSSAFVLLTNQQQFFLVGSKLDIPTISSSSLSSSRPSQRIILLFHHRLLSTKLKKKPLKITKKSMYLVHSLLAGIGPSLQICYMRHDN